MSLAITLANKMRLAKCDIMVGFANPVTFNNVLPMLLMLQFCEVYLLPLGVTHVATSI